MSRVLRPVLLSAFIILSCLFLPNYSVVQGEYYVTQNIAAASERKLRNKVKQSEKMLTGIFNARVVFSCEKISSERCMKIVQYGEALWAIGIGIANSFDYLYSGVDHRQNATMHLIKLKEIADCIKNSCGPFGAAAVSENQKVASKMMSATIYLTCISNIELKIYSEESKRHWEYYFKGDGVDEWSVKEKLAEPGYKLGNPIFTGGSFRRAAYLFMEADQFISCKHLEVSNATLDLIRHLIPLNRKDIF